MSEALKPHPSDLRPVSILDLTVEQLEALETDPRIGLPMTRWNEAPSQAYLLSSVLALGNGLDQQSLAHLSMRQLSAMVDVKNDQDDGPDPTRG